jgi:hypothetical protein
MITLIIVGAVALLLLSAALAPMEALGWYAGWYGNERKAEELIEPEERKGLAAKPPSTARHFMVYLSGIGAISADSIPDEELPFLNELERRLPGTKLVRDVFPYSVTNNGLTGKRTASNIWRSIEKARFKNPAVLSGFLINIRNTFQVLVSADSRYGPIYNLGVAEEIVRGLVRNGYQLGSGVPVTLVGWSGGGQISVGAADYLVQMIQAPMRIISIGGVMSSGPGLDNVTMLWHLPGSKDVLSPLGYYLYPGRWEGSVTSHWNRARREGRIAIIDPGPIMHNGKGNYFDMETLVPGESITCGEKVLEIIVNVLTRARLVITEAAGT